VIDGRVFTMSDVERAVSAFKEGFLCSQAITSTYGTKFGLERENALRIASGFGGGMGRLGETCGAVTGAIMVIGLASGWVSAGDGDAKEQTFTLIRKLVDEFTARNGTVRCKDLIDCDISTTEGLELARRQDVFMTRCPKFVQDAAEILEELL
jgi:C_GCAxxG_C_C family probable redox protein